MKQKIEYRVLTKMMYGWDDIWQDDKFETRDQAQAMIEDHVETCKDSDIEASLDDFKIIKQQVPSRVGPPHNVQGHKEK